MGDHRATIKIEFTLPNKTYQTEIGSMGGVNYVGDDDGIDGSVREFFRNSWNDYLSWYNLQIDEYFEQQNKAEIEARERRELERLKAKYEEPASESEAS